MAFYPPFFSVVTAVTQIVALSPVQGLTGVRYDTIPGNLELENDFDLLTETGGFLLLES